MDVPATLAEAWEAQHVPIDAPDPIAAVTFMMQQKALSRRNLEPAIGGRARPADSNIAGRHAGFDQVVGNTPGARHVAEPVQPPPGPDGKARIDPHH